MLINQSQELSPSEVDEVVEMYLEKDEETSIRRAVDACVKVLSVPEPSDERIQEALEVVGAYKPQITRGMMGNTTTRERVPAR